MKEIFGANWKSNPPTIEEGKKLLDSYAKEGLNNIVDKEIPVIVPYIWIPELYKHIKEKGYNFKLGAQNVSEHECGAFSGQIAANMLANVGVTEFLIGHSERRLGYEEKVLHAQDILIEHIDEMGFRIQDKFKKEFNAEAKAYINHMLNRKVRAVIEYNKNSSGTPDISEGISKHPLKVIYCVGETLDEKEEGRTLDVLDSQITIGLADLSRDDLQNIIVAYEPRWAIGHPKKIIPSREEIREAHAKIRGLTRDDIKILYGGSMNPDNVAEIMSVEGVNGGLIGGASLKPNDFARIVKYDQK
jgi:triosephosphate isomerase (TIM)